MPRHTNTHTQSLVTFDSFSLLVRELCGFSTQIKAQCDLRRQTVSQMESDTRVDLPLTLHRSSSGQNFSSGGGCYMSDRSHYWSHLGQIQANPHQSNQSLSFLQSIDWKRHHRLLLSLFSPWDGASHGTALDIPRGDGTLNDLRCPVQDWTLETGVSKFTVDVEIF